VITAGLGAAGLLFVIFFQWNWLRGPLVWYLEQQLHRPVAISGDLEVHPWSPAAWVRVNGLTIGSPREGPFVLSAPRLTLRMRWLPLLWGRLVLPLVWADSPRLTITDQGSGPSPWSTWSIARPGIDHLVITHGALAIVDRRHRMTFAGGLYSDETHGAARGPNDSTIAGALVLGGADWAGTRPMLDAPNFVLRMKLLPLMAGRLQIDLIAADQPQIHFARDADGRFNWSLPEQPTGPAPRVPPIGRLLISRGVLHYGDARLQLSFLGSVSTDETVTSVGRGRFLLQGHGSMRQASFMAQVRGGPLINIDPHRPYPLSVRLEAAGTRVAMDGVLARAFDPRTIVGRLHASGPDLADLYRLTGVALPATPPYDLSARFSRIGPRFALSGIAGRVGVSDLAGSLSVDAETRRPFLTADLRSRRLSLLDLSAVVGGVPKHPAGHVLSPMQRATSARLAVEHRVLPDAHLDVARIQSTDASVTYHAASVEAGRFPIHSLALKLSLDRGRLTIDPLTMTLPQGDVAAKVRLDATGAVPREVVDVRLANARLENLIGRGGPNPPMEGGLYAHARLTGRGDSVRAAAASADGEVSAFIAKGAMRQTLAELLGIDATKALLLVLTKNNGDTPIRCAAVDLQARSGVLTTRQLVLDTGVVLATGKGDIDLRDEALNLQLDGKPKKFRLVRIGAPITLKGSLASPKFGVDLGKAAGQLAVSGLLGAAVAPLSALLPFVNPGLAKNADCAELMRGAGLFEPPARKG
jgi:uncharacterized protein involved in outer membrane biogenesis